MPAFIKTEKDEEVWQKARQRVDDEYDYSEQGENYWKLVNSIYHKMKKNAELKIATELFNEISDDTLVKDIPEDILIELKQRNIIANDDSLTKETKEILAGGIDIYLDNLESLFKDYPEAYEELIKLWNTNECRIGTLYLVEDLNNSHNTTFKISLRV